MARLAWFTPLSPVKSGISQYSRELLPKVSDAHDVEVFVDGAPGRFVSPDSRVRVFDAHDFIWKHRREPYDLVVYQLGNAPCHDYMWAYLVRYPGLVVLHDGQLHHARARALLQQKRYDDYRAEFRFNHPHTNAELRELGAEGLLGSLTYLWPMRGLVIESSRMVLVHNEWLAEEIGEEHPNALVRLVEMGVPEPVVRADAGRSIRARHGIPADAVLFVAFGKVTPEKRIHQSIRGLAALRESGPQAHLLLAGETVDHYDPLEDARAFGVDAAVTVAGFVADDEIDDYLSAADVCLCLRWPSSRETSASWLRCIAAGRATITTDLVHTADIPALDPRSWTVMQSRPDAVPAAVAIDIIDEDHSLQIAMRTLATAAMLRAEIGRNARALWHERFRLDRMADRYGYAIAEAMSVDIDPAGRAHFPRHVLADGTEHTLGLLEAVGLSAAVRRDLWSST